MRTVPATDPCPLPERTPVDATAFAHMALFSGLDDATLMLLARRVSVRHFGADELIFAEGDAGRAMYVVLSGSVAMSKALPTGGSTHVTTAEAGDWFGELCLLDVMARPVSARTTAASELLAICPTDLSAVYRSSMKMYALLVMNLARQLSRKLRAAETSLCRARDGHDGDGG